jgi:hypothetical protein
MDGKESEFRKAVALAIRLSDEDDAKRGGRYDDSFFAQELRKLDRMSTFIATLGGALQNSDPELAAELSAFCKRIIHGETGATA